jgi:alpha-tubulin suppressor-like RCC1 family protein
VTGNHDFKSLTVASSTVCGIDTGNKAWCWGKNSLGQLGDGSTTDTKNPTAVDPGNTFSAIAASTSNDQSFCALLTDGAVKCWGANTYGQSHPGSIAPATTPGTIGDFKDLNDLTMGAGFSCVTDKRNEASCWGQNDTGQTGTGSTEVNRLPSPAARKDFMPRPFTGDLKGGAE